jgi:hypothetical protein
MEKSLPAETIHGDGIILRKHCVDEAALVFQCVDADRERLQQFLPFVPYIQSEKDELGYILNSRARGTIFRNLISDFCKKPAKPISEISVHLIFVGAAVAVKSDIGFSVTMKGRVG